MKHSLRIEFRGKSGVVPVPPAPEMITIGSNPGCRVVLKDPAVDSVHLEVESTPAGVRIRDCGTREGTRVNGALVGQATLTPGDEVRIGEARITLAAAGAEAAPAPPPVAPKPAAARKPPAAPKPAAPPPKPVAAAPAVSPAPSRAGARARTTRKNPLLYVVIGLLLAGVVAGAFLMGGETDTERAEKLLTKAVAVRNGGDREAARKAFGEVVEKYPSSPAAARASRILEDIEREFAHEEEAWAARKELRESWRTRPLADFEKRWEAFRTRYEGTEAAADPDFLAEVKKDYAAAGKERFEEARMRSRTREREGRWYDAMLVWHEYLSLPGLVPPDVEGATREFRGIEERARAAFEKVAAKAGEMIDAERYDEAAALLAAHRDEFRNTRFSFDLRQRMELVDVLRRRTEGEAAPTAAEAKREVDAKEKYLREAEDAEELVRGRRYAQAVAAYEKLAASCPHEDLAAEFRDRAADLAGYARIFTELREQVRDHPERFRAIDLGNGFTANATGADDGSLSVDVHGSQVKLSFARMSAPRLLSLLVRLVLDPEGKLAVARFAYEAGDEEKGSEYLSAAIDGDESLRDRAFGVLARARGIEVPAGGFVAYRGRWMTPTERDAAEMADRIADAEKLAGSSDARKRDEGLAALREMGAPARPALVRALTKQYEAAVDLLTHLPALRDPGTKGWLYSELEKRRKAALALIFDTEKYPYPHPDGPAYEKVQAEVVSLVDAVREVWERPAELIAARNEEVKDAWEGTERYATELAGLGAAPEPSVDDLKAKVNAAVAIQRYAPGGTEKSALEWNDKVLDYNREIDIDADAEERACVDALNAYRIMMGRRAVKWSDKLLEAARAHSREMKEKGYFAHDCPLPGPEHDAHRRPTDRARQAGYGGGVSENIAMGSTTGVGAFTQWFGSSGHHRNMLGNHTEVGVGRDDNYWTQNFGSASKSLDLPRKKRDGN